VRSRTVPFWLTYDCYLPASYILPLPDGYLYHIYLITICMPVTTYGGTRTTFRLMPTVMRDTHIYGSPPTFALHFCGCYIVPVFILRLRTPFVRSYTHTLRTLLPHTFIPVLHTFPTTLITYTFFITLLHILIRFSCDDTHCYTASCCHVPHYRAGWTFGLIHGWCRILLHSLHTICTLRFCCYMPLPFT